MDAQTQKRHDDLQELSERLREYAKPRREEYEQQQKIISLTSEIHKITNHGATSENLQDYYTQVQKLAEQEGKEIEDHTFKKMRRMPVSRGFLWFCFFISFMMLGIVNGEEINIVSSLASETITAIQVSPLVMIVLLIGHKFLYVSRRKKIKPLIDAADKLRDWSRERGAAAAELKGTKAATADTIANRAENRSEQLEK